MEDIFFMEKAICLAKLEAGEVPVGAIIVHNNKIIAQAHNQKEIGKNPLLHAEMIAINQAAQQRKQWRLLDCTLYVTLEPCPMCMGAIIQSRIPRLVYGCKDPKGGADSLYQLSSDTRLNHQPQVQSGVLEEQCGKLLSNFFHNRRKERKNLSPMGAP